MCSRLDRIFSRIYIDLRVASWKLQRRLLALLMFDFILFKMPYLPLSNSKHLAHNLVGVSKHQKLKNL